MTNPEQDGIVTESSTHEIKPDDQVVEAEQAEQEPVEKAESDEQSPDDSSEKPSKRPGRRERQLERERQENLRITARNQELEALVAKLKPESQGKSENGEPQEADYDNVLDYLKAQSKWDAEQAAESKLTAYQQKQAEAAEEAQFVQRLDALEEREEVFAQQIPDYHEKVDALVSTGVITKDVLKAIVSSDISEQVAYHLTQYPQDAYLMAQMGNNKQALNQAVRQIENFIESNPITAVKQTKAAAPIKPVQSKAGTSNKIPDADTDQQDYERWRYSGR